MGRAVGMMVVVIIVVVVVFFFNDTATTEIYTLSLHDALPISSAGRLMDFSTIRGVPFIGWLLRC